MKSILFGLPNGILQAYRIFGIYFFRNAYRHNTLQPFGLFAAVLAMLDITIKSCIENGITRKEERETLKGKVILRKVYNRGFGLNVLQNDPDTVKYVSSFATIILTITQLIQLMRKKGSKLKKIGLSLMTAGAWSNTFDRWLRGYVIDYIGFENKNKKIEKITWNLGDFFLIAGGIIVSLGSLLHKKK